MSKINKESNNISEEKVNQLKQVLPECFTEGKIDSEKLNRTLGNILESSDDKYSFSWAGRNDTFKTIQTTSKGTLIPVKEQSINFETTENIFIEGDNLEVLKLLQKSYFEQIKMIYIDPPYNTGNDFVYKDDFHNSIQAYLEQTGQAESGVKLTTNHETSGRFHSDWISFMYARLFVARNLLREDGVIFVSIDDNEVHNLKMIMNEIFGEESFIAQFVWKSRQNKDNRNVTGASIDHEYVLCYGKRIRGGERKLSMYSNPDKDARGDWASGNMVGLLPQELRPNCHYDLINPKTKINYGKPKLGWRYDKNTMSRLITENRIIWPDSPTGRPRRKVFLSELKEKFTGFSSIIGDGVYTKDGTVEIEEIFGSRVIEFPKPTKLIKQIIIQGSEKDDIILDFFAGSGTTAQSILELNHEDNGNRRFILVQLPESIQQNSATWKEGYKTIADICKERISRVIKKLHSDNKGKLPIDREQPEDLGFKVFKLSKSNFNVWENYEGRDTTKLKDQMKLFQSPLIAKYRDQDVIYECIIKEGFSLNSNVEKISIKNNTVYKVDDIENFFCITLDKTVKDETLNELNLGKEDIFICIDAALDDSKKTNLAKQCTLKTM